jgi:hypothetical protein
MAIFKRLISLLFSDSFPPLPHLLFCFVFDVSVVVLLQDLYGVSERDRDVLW